MKHLNHCFAYDKQREQNLAAKSGRCTKILTKGLCICFIVCSIFLISCSLPSYIPEGYTPLRDTNLLSDEAVVLPVKLVQQEEQNLCGFSAISMIANYYNIIIPESVSTKITETAENQESGLSAGQIQEFFNLLNLKSFVFSGEISNTDVTGIFYHIDKKRPVIAMIRPTGADDNHYVIVTGYDPKFKNIIIQDPQIGNCLIPYDMFLKHWKDCKNLMIVAIK